MGPPRLLTLTTDFGNRDSYVGQMKGAALSVAPDLCIVDLCHEVPAQQIAAGAYVLERRGIALFERIEADPETADDSAIVGLPLMKLLALLRRFGWDVLNGSDRV